MKVINKMTRIDKPLKCIYKKDNFLFMKFLEAPHAREVLNKNDKNTKHSKTLFLNCGPVNYRI